MSSVIDINYGKERKTFRLHLVLLEDFGRLVAFACRSAYRRMGQTGLINTFRLQNATPLTAWSKTEMAHTHIGMNPNRIELFLTQQLVVVGVVVCLM
jgi:hypothetical protein